MSYDIFDKVLVVFRVVKNNRIQMISDTPIPPTPLLYKKSLHKIDSLELRKLSFLSIFQVFLR